MKRRKHVKKIRRRDIDSAINGLARLQIGCSTFTLGPEAIQELRDLYKFGRAQARKLGIDERDVVAYIDAGAHTESMPYTSFTTYIVRDLDGMRVGRRRIVRKSGDPERWVQFELPAGATVPEPVLGYDLAVGGVARFTRRQRA